MVKSQFETIVGDGRGQAVYSFGKEENRTSECYAGCARAWAPVLTKSRPVAGNGVHAEFRGATRRRDGKRQVNYRGRALHYYVADSPGRVLCRDVREFGGPLAGHKARRHTGSLTSTAAPRATARTAPRRR